MPRVRASDHGEQAVGHPSAIDSPLGIELLMTAMLRVDLGKHEQLDVCRVPCQRTARPKDALEILHFRLVKGQAKPLVGFLKGLSWMSGFALQLD